MSKMKYTRIAIVSPSEANVIESYLEAEGIDVELFQDSVDHIYTISFSPVQIFVPRVKVQQALALLENFDLGMEKDDDEEG